MLIIVLLYLEAAIQETFSLYTLYYGVFVVEGLF